MSVQINLISYIILLFILLLLSALFTAFESAVFNSSSVKLRSKYKHSHIATKIIEFKKHPEKFISSVVVANNFVNIFFTAVMTFLAIEISAKTILSETTSVIIATIISTVIIVIFGETIPKNIGAYRPERISIILYRFLTVFWYILKPFAYILSKITKILLSLFGIKSSERKTFEGQEDVLSMIELGKEEGVIEKTEEKMIYSIFEFGDTLVREIMIPRVDMIAIDEESEYQTIAKVIVENGHSRIPVYHEQIDNIIGILYIKDFLKFNLTKKNNFNIKEIVRPAYFVPETKRVDELFGEMQKNKIQIAMVFDEYGGISGLVTLEDILEEIVGEIQDEYEVENKMLQKIGENVYLASGTLSIEEFNEAFGTNFSDEEASTIGGLVLEKLGRLPTPGEEIKMENVRFIISKIRDRRIIQVKAILKEKEEKNE